MKSDATMRPRKTKVDGGSRWRWFAEPVPDRGYLAVATYIELRSVWDLPRFEWYTLRVYRQLARAQGLVGYSFRGEFPRRYWTLSAWEDGRVLRGFVKAGTHEAVRAALTTTMRRFRHVHWPVTGSALPLAWADGLRRLDRTNTGPVRPAGYTAMIANARSKAARTTVGGPLENIPVVPVIGAALGVSPDAAAPVQCERVYIGGWRTGCAGLRHVRDTKASACTIPERSIR